MEEDLKLGKDIEELQKRIIENAKKIERITKQIEANADKIENNAGKIGNNSEKIEYNSGALEILHTFKSDTRKFFVLLIIVLIMWFSTIAAFLYYINTIDYQETVEQAEIDNESGNANACIGDKCNNGEINYGEDKVSKEN